ncbi:hypothetical protein GCM10027176_36880 [Actinoallomurus bryophytorum]|nr:proline hydroxylase [Actinoallomurus bryophytorum]
MERYESARVNPPIARFGPVVNDYLDGQGLRSEYWEDVLHARRCWSTWMGDTDPLAYSIDHLSEAWGTPLRPARVSGRDLFLGAVREINNGALIHFDDVRREFGSELFDDGTPAVQLAFNAWTSVPTQGGTTRIWRHKWNPADVTSRNGYGYHPVVVDGEQTISLSAGLGDALLFDPRYFHAVDPGLNGRRVAITFFLGFTSRGELIAWS